MNDTQITYDTICTYVGRLYLTQQQAFDRQQASFEVYAKQLNDEIGRLKADLGVANELRAKTEEDLKAAQATVARKTRDS